MKRASMLAQPGRPSWIEVDRHALLNNVEQIRRTIGDGCELCGVVKANAYGHGVLLVTELLHDAGVTRFAVATLAEAVEMRDGGVVAPILVLGYTPARHARDAVRSHVALTIFDADMAKQLDSAAEALDATAVVHVKVNTGMNRLGLRPADVVRFLDELRELPHVVTEGLYTHFATSDTDLKFASVQFERFRRLVYELEAVGLRPPICHAANSAAMLMMPETHIDMVRCGIALYGLDPDEECTPIPDSYRPVLSWKAEIAQVSELEVGEGVSYGLEFVAESPTVTAVIPVGYADGFPRRPLHWGHVLVNGRPAPIIGRVCMDQTVVNVTAIVADGVPVLAGDEAVLIGRQGDAEISAEEVARRLGTINYDVVSRILSRVPRVVAG